MFDTITYLVGSFDKAKDVFFFMGTGGFMAILALCLWSVPFVDEFYNDFYLFLFLHVYIST
jgi:hypothetical protein